jgi:hypothetical protein
MFVFKCVLCVRVRDTHISTYTKSKRERMSNNQFLGEEGIVTAYI